MSDVRATATATRRSQTPGLQPLDTTDAHLRRWAEGVREAVDVLIGARGVPFDRAATLRDLQALGVDIAPLLAGGVQSRRSAQAVTTLNGRNQDEVEALAREILVSQVFKATMDRIDTIYRLVSSPDAELQRLGSEIEALAQARMGDLRELRTALNTQVQEFNTQLTELDNEVKVNATLIVNGIRSNEMIDVLTGVSFGLGVPWTTSDVFTQFGSGALYTGGMFRSNSAGKFASVHLHTADGIASAFGTTGDTDSAAGIGALGSFDETDGKFLTLGMIGLGDTAGFFARRHSRDFPDWRYWAKLATAVYALETNGPIRIGGSLSMDGQLTGTGTLVWNGNVEIEGQLFVNGVEIGTGSLIGTKIWSYTIPGNPLCYSTPIQATVRDAGGSNHDSVIFQAWDGYLYAVDITDGTLVWRYAFSGPNYGRPQAADVNGDGYNEVIGASHDGTVRCVSSQGSLLWTFSNLYDREATGTLTDAGDYYIEDSTKNWANNSFQRGDPSINGYLLMTSGVAAGKEMQISSSRGTDGFWLVDLWDVDKTPSAGDSYVIMPRYSSDRFYQHAGTLNQESGTWYLYLGGFDNQMVKLNASTGALVWKVCTLENIEPFPHVVTLGGSTRIIFVSVDGYVRAMNTDGTVYWQSNIGYPLDAFLATYDIDTDGNVEVLVSSRSNRVHILNGTTGVQKSQTPDTQGDIDSRPLVVDTDAIVVAGDAGHIQRFTYATTTMTQDWDYAASAVPFNSSPVLLDVDDDATDEAICIDMTGLGFAMDVAAGTVTGRFQAPGAVEGTPLAGDFLSVAGEKQLIYTALGGVVEMVTFPKR